MKTKTEDDSQQVAQSGLSVTVGSALNGVGMIDGKPVRFRMPDYTNDDYGPEIGDANR